MSNHIIKAQSTTLGMLEEYYNEIDVDTSVSVDGDVSMILVSKLLLHPRLTDSDSPVIKLWKSNLCYHKSDLQPEENGKCMFLDHVFFDDYYLNNINITEMQLDTENEDYSYILEMTDKYLNQRTKRNFERNTAAELFISQKASKTVRIYIDKETNQSIIVTPKLSVYAFHLISSLLPLLLPKYFEGDKALTEWEHTLLNSLLEVDPKKFITLINDYAKEHNIRDERIRKLLKGFTKSFSIYESNTVKERIRETNRSIDSYYSTIAGLYIELQKQEDRLKQLLERAEADTDKEENEIVDFITSCKGINLTNVSGSSMTLSIKTPLRNYDLDLIERYFETERSIVHVNKSYYPNGYGDYTTEMCERLIKAVFLDNTLDVMMSGVITIDFRNENYLVSNIRPTYTALDDTVHNPHLTYYSCLGSNRQALYNALRDRNYLDAISVCVSSVGNVNIGETTNFLNFLRDLFKTKGQVLVRRSDNTSMTVDEAMTWLKEADNEQTD